MKSKLVPVEPTAAMIEAIEGASYTFATGEEEWEGEVSEFMAEDIYRAMLAAAPAPAFDEVAERAEAKRNWLEVQPYFPILEDFTAGWLACARLKAEVGHE
jgi:hypothetical protein